MPHFYNLKRQAKVRRRLRCNMPEPEQILWRYLRGRQMFGVKFRRQYGIGKYVVDFYSPKLRLAIEIDGESHYIDGGPSYDKLRQSYLEAMGVSILRFTNTDICKNIDGVLSAIQEIIKKRSTPSNSPLFKGEKI